MPKKLPKLATTFDAYTIGKLLGQGGSGRVYAATDGSGQAVAIKILDSGDVSRERTRRFKNELMFCLRNEHPNIVTVSDFGTSAPDGSGDPFYVMPLYACTLRDLINKGISTSRVVPLFSQILDGVEAAHIRGVIHRDLKPENIFFDEKADRLLVGDFGVARFTEQELATLVETKPQTRLANFLYAAPEQRIKNQAVDLRADVFALGLILYEMVTGQVPQGTGFKSVGSVQSTLAYLDDIAAKMIRHSPSDRFASISGIKSELIARGNSFVQQQKLDELKRQAVPSSTVTDPLVAEPLEPISVDYDGRALVFTLSQAPNPQWINVFRQITGVSFYPGQEPSSIGFSGNKATFIMTHDGQAQSLIGMFKEYVKAANRDYATKLAAELQRQEREARERLTARIEAEERRQTVLRSLKL